jgi:predicted aspartyl protease
MTGKVFPSAGASRIVLAASLAVAFLFLPARRVFAVDCSIVKHDPPTEADSALLTADYAKAEGLYRDELAKHPGDPSLATGLVHALLRQQKVQEAADAVKASLTASPGAAALVTLRGEVEFRQGMPWAATDTANQSFKLDPCNPRTHLLIASIASISSFYAVAQREIATAHQLDPEDPDIRGEWIGTMPLEKRIHEIEGSLAAPSGGESEDLRHMHMYLDRLRTLTVEPHEPCHLVSTTASTEIPFFQFLYDPKHIRAYGLEVKFNNTSARLEVDTGAGGLLISRTVAERAGLKPFSQSEMSGIGDQGYKPGYTAFADSIRIGNLDFKDCTVRVLDSRSVLGDTDGLIGMDVFSRFLVTLDYPMRKMLLGPLPPRPGEAIGAEPGLNTNDAESDDSGTSSEAAANGPHDRYVAPEMKDYTRVYRVGHDLILPAALNGAKLKLFILDTGAWATSISPQAAREVTKVHADHEMEIKGISGKVEKVFTADQITFTFGHMSQKVYDVASFDTSNISKSVGMDISGFLGAATLKLLTIHIDYRDGLVKFDYDANRGYKF